jgi:hypothetical protein
MDLATPGRLGISAMTEHFRFVLVIVSRSHPWCGSIIKRKATLLQVQRSEGRIDVFEMNVERAKTIDFRR